MNRYKENSVENKVRMSNQIQLQIKRHYVYNKSECICWMLLLVDWSYIAIAINVFCILSLYLYKTELYFFLSFFTMNGGPKLSNDSQTCYFASNILF